MQASCGQGCRHVWHLQAYSICGSCTTTGTEYSSAEGVPNSFFVPQDQGLTYTNTMNEAAWLMNPNTGASTEAGYFSGWWTLVSPAYWIAGLVPYGTENDGSAGFFGTDLTENLSLKAEVDQSGKETIVWQNGQDFWGCLCFPAIPTPRENAAQGEIHAYDTDQLGYPWLGNCSNNSFFMTFQSASSGGWGNWGNLHLTFSSTTGSISPYWYSQQSAYEWTNGGC